MQGQQGSSRVRRSAAEWRRIIREQERSGMSVGAFAAERGIIRRTGNTLSVMLREQCATCACGP